MSKQTKPVPSWAILAPLWAALTFASYGHEQVVHMAISRAATDSSQGLSAFLQNNFGEGNAPFLQGPKLVFHPRPGNPPFVYNVYDISGYSPIGWILQGS